MPSTNHPVVMPLLPPLADQPPSVGRLDLASKNLTVETEAGPLPLVLGMEMDGLVLPIEHPDHDAKKGRDDRHG